MPPIHIVHYAETGGSTVITGNIIFIQKANTASFCLGRWCLSQRPTPNANQFEPKAFRGMQRQKPSKVCSDKDLPMSLNWFTYVHMKYAVFRPFVA